MSENSAAQVTENFYEKDYVEDEFGIGLKGYLLARFVFMLTSVFAALGALLCLAVGLILPSEIASSLTGMGSGAVNANYMGLTIVGYAQAAYSIIGAFTVLWLMVKRSRLAAIIDLAAFVVFFALSIVLGGVGLFGEGAPCWFIFIILNPVFSFIALFAGKHFKYMPFK